MGTQSRERSRSSKATRYKYQDNLGSHKRRLSDPVKGILGFEGWAVADLTSGLSRHRLSKTLRQTKDSKRQFTGRTRRPSIWSPKIFYTRMKEDALKLNFIQSY